jgi:hypothetical protein
MNAIIFFIFAFLQESDFLPPSLVEREAHFRHPSTYFFPERFHRTNAVAELLRIRIVVSLAAIRKIDYGCPLKWADAR